MMKKIGLTALVAVIGLGLLSRTDVGRWAFSHLRLAGSDAAAAVRSMVSLETEIKRIDHEIDELKSDISASYPPLAREMVEVETLKKDVTASEKDVAARESVVKSLKVKLEDSSSDKATAEFTAAWKSFQIAERNLSTKKEVLQRKEELVEQSKEKIKAMVNKQGLLKVKLAGMRADLEKVRVAQVESNVKVDDSRLAGIEKDMQAVEKRISEMNTELSLKEKFNNGAESVEAKVEQAKALEEFDSRFGPKAKVVKEK
jgi:hypothetical protein